MEKVGKLLTCDRCGKQIFLEKLGEATTDGGYTKFTRYKDKPEGWMTLLDERKTLCPECSGKYNNMINEFFSEVKRYCMDG